MLGGQRPSVDGELQVSTESIGLTDFDPGALTHVVTGAEFEHRRLQGGDSEINLLHCRLPHSVINRGMYSPSVLVNGIFASDAITMGAMLRQREATIGNGAEMKMGTVQFYAEKSEMCYRAWPNATWFAFVSCASNFKFAFVIRFCFGQFLGRIGACFPQCNCRLGDGRSSARHLPAHLVGTKYRLGYHGSYEDNHS